MARERTSTTDSLNQGLRQKIDRMASLEDRLTWRVSMVGVDAAGLSLITASMAGGQWKHTAIFAGLTLACKAALAVINRPVRN